MSDSILNSPDFLNDLRLGLDDAYVILWREGFKLLNRYYIKHGLIDDAEDVWSETHMKLRRTKCASFDPKRGSFRSWLFTVGVNAAKDQIRRRGDNISLDDCPELAAPDTSKEKDEGGSQYLKVLVNRALASLSRKDRIILSLRVVRRLSVDSITNELGISTAAVAMRVSRALERLYLEMERLSTRELPRRIRRPERKHSGRVVSTSYQK